MPVGDTHENDRYNAIGRDLTCILCVLKKIKVYTLLKWSVLCLSPLLHRADAK